MKRATAFLLLVIAVTTLPRESLGFQGIAKTTVWTGQTPPPKSRVEPPPSELSMGLIDVSLFTDLVPDIRVLKYIQLMLADPENIPILISAVSSFLVLTGIWSTTPEDSSSSFSKRRSQLEYAPAADMGGSATYQASTFMEPPTAISDPYQQQQQQRSSWTNRGVTARGSVTRLSTPVAAKLPVMQDRYQPLSYGPMNQRSGGTSPLKTMLSKASGSTLEKPVVVTTPVVAAPQQQSSPKRFTSSTRDVGKITLKGSSVHQKTFQWSSGSSPANQQRTGDVKWASPVQQSNEQARKVRQPPISYAPVVSSSSAGSYLESLGGGVGAKPKQSSYAPTKRFVTAAPNALGSNSYLDAMSAVPTRGSDSPATNSPTSSIGSGQSLQDTPGFYLETLGGGAKMKESSYVPTKASVGTKVIGNALGNSYFAAMGSGRSAPTTVYQYSPTEMAARAALNPVVSIGVASSIPASEIYSSDGHGASSEAQGSYLDTVGSVSSSRKESSYAPTKPSVMTKPMGNAMGSAYFASMGVSGGIPPTYSYLLSDEPEPPTAGAMKPYLSTLTKENSSGTRPSSYAPTKSGVGKMSSTTVGSSYLQMMGRTSSAAKSQFSAADPRVSHPPHNSIQGTTSPNADPARQSEILTTATEAGSYLDALSGGKQKSLSKKQSFAPTQSSVSKKSGTTLGGSYLTSLGR